MIGRFEMAYRRTVLTAAVAAGALGTAAYWATRPSYSDAVAGVWTSPKPGDLPEADYLVHYARLAANSHNTQPWVFRVRKGGIDILPDASRATPVVDPDNHHLYASLGCAAENLALAAGSLGQRADIGFASDGIRVDLLPGGAIDPLFAAITQRQCTRSAYDGSTVSAEDQALLAAAATVEGAQVMILADPAEVAPVADLILAGVRAQTDDPAFVEELRGWLRFSTSRAVSTGDGLYSACSGNPVLPEWLGGFLFARFFTADAKAEKAKVQITSSVGLAVIVSDRDDPEHWVAAGRSYQRFALQATALGLKHAFMNQAVEVPETRAALAAHLGLGGRRPDLILRFGRAADLPKSLRRPLADVSRAT